MKQKNAPSQRQLRVAENVKHALVDFFQRGEICDPQISNAIICVSEISMSPDLKWATCYITVFGADPEKNTLVIAALNKHRSFIRGRVGVALRTMKYIPAFRFELDSSFNNYQKIDTLLRSEAVARDLQPKDNSEDEI